MRSPDIGSLAPKFLGPRSKFLDVDSLKRNAEYLTISRLLCASENHAVETDGIRRAYSFLSDNIELICSRHPQYYRMLLSIAYNLYFFEIIDKKTLDQIFKDAQLSRAFDVETSDICKLDAHYIFGLHDKKFVLFDNERIVARSEKFLTAMYPFSYPNRDAGYTFTHIIFFLTSMGAEKLPFSGNFQNIAGNLLNIGTFCYLSDDHDLMAEVALCLIFLKCEKMIPDCWVSSLNSEYRRMINDDAIDDYHKFLVVHWFRSTWETGPNSGENEDFQEKNGGAGKSANSDLTILSDFGERLADYEIHDKKEVRRALEQYATSATAGKFFDVEAYHHDADTIWRAIIGKDLF